MAGPRLVEALRLVAESEVEVIVVGMVAAALQGVPLTTFGLDLVHRRTRGNVARALAMLEGMGASYRGDPARRKPTEAELMGPGRQALTTELGDIDFYGEIDGGRTYIDLGTRAITMEVGDT